MNVLDIVDLTVGFTVESGVSTVVDRVSFSVGQGEVVGLVGESGSGKSVTAMSIVSLLPSPPSQLLGGTVALNGVQISGLSNKELQKVRGAQVGFIFQEPMTSLNPVYTIGFQLIEAIRIHEKIKKSQARERSIDMLKRVGVSEPEIRMKQYPHELSGGLRQRVMITMAVLCGPQLLIADEPTTALDVTIQAQILQVLQGLKSELNLSMLLITHDLGVVSEVCDRVVVMYAGRIIEEGKTTDVLQHPQHPYTAALLQSSPSLDERVKRLSTIPGRVKAPQDRGAGCNFVDRCVNASTKCFEFEPELVASYGTQVACWNPVS
jgi:oligopeptide/dipeptide ABC transporter ATP-binding protein